jgi:hypothetical protein
MPKDDVLDHRVSRNQFAVLVDHADAPIDGIQTRAEINWFPGNINFPFVGLVFSEEDFHQGRFSSTILAEDGVNLAGFYFEVNMVIGNNTGESLRDSSRF